MSRTLFLAVLIAAPALVACVDNNADSGLIILRNVAPASGCVIATDSTVFQPSGIIQTDSAQGYLLTPVVRNDLTLFEGESETAKTVFIEGAQVTIGFYDKDLFSAAEQATFVTDGVTRFLVPSSGSIEPNGGLATFAIEVVPRELLVAIETKLPGTDATTLLDVTVQIVGRRSGTTIESNSFRYPVEVCIGCLRVDVGACAGLPSDFMGNSGGACNPKQDGRLDCCLSAGPPEVTVCPATSSMPT